MATTTDKGLDLKPLARAAKTLEALQGDRARRNARQRTRAVLNQLLAQVDQLYPAPKAKRGTRKISTVAQQRRWLIANEWVTITTDAEGMAVLAFCAREGFPLRTTKEFAQQVRHDSHSGKWSGLSCPKTNWCPAWVATNYPNATACRKASKDNTAKRAAAASVRLGALNGKRGFACVTA